MWGLRSAAFAEFGAAWEDLWHDLQLVAACARLGGSWEIYSVSQVWQPLVPVLGLLSWSYLASWDWMPLMPCLEAFGEHYNASWGQLPLVWGCEPLVLYEAGYYFCWVCRTLEDALSGWSVWIQQCLREMPGLGNSVDWASGVRLMDSDKFCASLHRVIWVGGELSKRTMVPASASVSKEFSWFYPSTPRLKVRQFNCSSMAQVFLELLPLPWNVERVTKCVNPLVAVSRFPAAFCLSAVLTLFESPFPHRLLLCEKMDFC